MTFSDCYYMGNKPAKTKEAFIQEYERLCRSYKMRIGLTCNESGTDMGQDVEELCLPEEIEEHIEELKDKCKNKT